MADRKKELGIVTTNLTMRFYRRQGWTLELLMGLMEKTQENPPFKFFDDAPIESVDMAYWIPKVGTVLDVDWLLDSESFKNFSIRVNRTFDDYPDESDLEHLKRHNW